MGIYQNWKDLDAIAALFVQVACYDGVLNKEQYMRAAKMVNISDYTLVI